MSEDIGLELFEICEKEFKKKLGNDKQLKQLLKRINSKDASFLDANAFSIRVGELLSSVFKENVSEDVLPNGKMYYNIAKKLVDPLMKQDHACISEVCSIVQKTMNENSRIGLNAKKPVLNQDRIDGIVNGVSHKDKYNDAKHILQEPIVNFSQSVVDDAIRTNAEFQFKSGMSPKIVRTSTGHCCDWCMNLVGVYNYEDVSDTGNDVFRRHKYCRCNVDYIPSEGKRQNVHSRQWYKDDKVKYEKVINLQDEVRRSKVVLDPAQQKEINYGKDKITFIKIKDTNAYVSENAKGHSKRIHKCLDSVEKAQEILKMTASEIKNSPTILITSEKDYSMIRPLENALGGFNFAENTIRFIDEIFTNKPYVKEILSYYSTDDILATALHENIHYLRTIEYVGRTGTTDAISMKKGLNMDAKNSIEKIVGLGYSIVGICDFIDENMRANNYDEALTEFLTFKLVEGSELDVFLRYVR